MPYLEDKPAIISVPAFIRLYKISENFDGDNPRAFAKVDFFKFGVFANNHSIAFKTLLFIKSLFILNKFCIFASCFTLKHHKCTEKTVRNKTVKDMRYIELPKSRKSELRRKFGVSGMTVWSALAFKWNSDLAKAIRKEALSLGGVETNLIRTRGFVPNCEIAYERNAAGTVTRIVQTWKNGVRLAIDTTSNSGAITVNGERFCDDFQNMTITDWGDAVLVAQSLSETLNS